MNDNQPFVLKPVKLFQIRWKEGLGHQECPYMYRWIWNLGLFSIRVHKWIRSDDKRHFHNHPWNFLTFVIKGSYTDVSLNTSNGEVTWDKLKRFSIRYRPASHMHYVDVPKEGAWTIMITGPKAQKWGFWVNNHLWRPLRFFHKYGHPPCSEQ
jgi:hypothetical protein